MPGNASDGRSLENLIRIEAPAGSVAWTVIYTVPQGTRFVLTGASVSDGLLILSSNGDYDSRFAYEQRVEIGSGGGFAARYPDGLAFEGGEQIHRLDGEYTILSGYLIPDE